MAANFDNSAWFYDKLAFVVFRKALINAQLYLLSFIPANSSILVAGGGTGWILEEIAKIHPSGLTITYVEVSTKMMARSKKRNAGNNTLLFITNAIEDVTIKNTFDIVITPFLLDNFTEQTLQKVLNHIHLSLKPGGIWLNSSFQVSGKWWHKALLKSMYLFFKIFCNIEASKLPDIEKQYKHHRYKAIANQTFFSDFIIAEIYKKTLK